MHSLLARFAESFFWMARYMERVENLARILDVNATFARNDAGEAEWLPIVHMQSDEAAFFARHSEATAEAVLPFYLLDRENQNSVHYAAWMAHENARSLRHLVSLELWSQLNIFYNDVASLRAEHVRLADLSRLCATIKEGCQLHTGIAEGTLYRDQGWYFYALGKALERADQVTRLLDVKYMRLLPASASPGSPTDASQWNALLRSVAAWHAFRREHPRGMRPESVVGFLLLNRAFPRSVRACVGQLRELLFVLVNGFGLESLRPVADDTTALDRELGQADPASLARAGLHDFVNDLQLRFAGLSSGLAATAFLHQTSAAQIQVQA